MLLNSSLVVYNSKTLIATYDRYKLFAAFATSQRLRDYTFTTQIDHNRINFF